MKRYKVLKIIVCVILFSIAIFQLKDYLIYKNIRDNEKPIKYEYIDKTVHKGGRGEYYSIKILYKQREATVGVTSKNFQEIEKNKLPAIFYSKESQTFFSEWIIKKKFRIMVMLFSFSLLVLLPFENFFRNETK